MQDQRRQKYLAGRKYEKGGVGEKWLKEEFLTPNGRLQSQIMKDHLKDFLCSSRLKTIVRVLTGSMIYSGYTTAIDRVKILHPKVELNPELTRELYDPEVDRTKFPWQKGFTFPDDSFYDDLSAEEEVPGEEGEEENIKEAKEVPESIPVSEKVPGNVSADVPIKDTNITPPLSDITPPIISGTDTSIVAGNRGNKYGIKYSYD